MTAARAPVIRRFTIPGDGSVNTYWIETPHGLVLIDSQRDPVSANQLLSELRATGKPVVAVLLTHPHPDHIGGLDVLRRAYPEMAIYASQATAEMIKSDANGFQKITVRDLEDRAPASYPVPNRIIAPGDRLNIAGLTIETQEFGKGESSSANTYYLADSGAVFAGDIVINGMTDALLEGRTRSWLAQIEHLRALYPKARILYPGHGAPGEPVMLMNEEAEYLRFVRATVRTPIDEGQLAGDKLTDVARHAVVSATIARFGHRPPVVYPLSEPRLIEMNADAVAAELFAERAPR